LLVAVLVFGVSAKGAQRWIDLPGLPRFQPSEIMKIVVPMVLASFLSERSLPPRFGVLCLALLLLVMPAVLIAVQPDLGTSLMLIFIGATMLLVEGLRRRAIWLLTIVTLVGVPLGWQFGLRSYQKDRVFKVLDPEWEKTDPETGTVFAQALTQGEQAIIAIGNGGLLGQGHRGANPVRMKGLPEHQTDFISAVFGEEFGFLGFGGGVRGCCG
jgi:rod shape determining protein RodA